MRKGCRSTSTSWTDHHIVTPDHHIPVGYVRRAHGIGGDVVVRGMVSDASERFVADAVLTTGEPEARSFTIDSVRIHKGDFLVSLVGVGDKRTADALVGVQFVIDPAERRTLDEDEWWAEDLIGRDVVSVDGEALGEVSEVVSGAAQDRLVVLGVGGTTFEVPFVDALVPAVHDDRIVVDLPEGLIG